MRSHAWLTSQEVELPAQAAEGELRTSLDADDIEKSVGILPNAQCGRAGDRPQAAQQRQQDRSHAANPLCRRAAGTVKFRGRYHGAWSGADQPQNPKRP
jgi:hypothetical protein